MTMQIILSTVVSGMVPSGIVQCTKGKILCDSPEHEDVIIFLGEDFTAAFPVILCLIILYQRRGLAGG